MSVVVLGMEMPENCHECRLCMQEADTELGVCAYCGLTGFGWEAYSDRPDWCHLRPLPEKHGRLGDLDELKTSFADSINECKKWIKELEENGDNETQVIANQAFCTIVEAALRLKSSPNIVEAEGD